MQKASEVVPFDLTPLDCRDNDEENCLVFESSVYTVVLPVVECIRAFFTPCKFLAYGILEPDFLRRIIKVNQVQSDQKYLKLEFTTEVARSSLNPPVVAHIARLLHDPSFNRAWDFIHANRRAEAGLCDAPGHWPLRCQLPELAPAWTVRAQRYARNVLMVLEVLHVQPAKHLPFKNVIFTHPSLFKKSRQERPKIISKQKVTARPDKNSAATLNRSPTPPKQPREPRLIKIRRLAVSDDSVLNIHKILQAVAPDDAPESRRKKIARHTVVSGGVKKLSLSDQGGRGTDSAAEFSPEQDEPIDCTPGQGLKEFSRVIICLRDDHPEVSLKWLLRPLAGQETAFTMVGDQPRVYAAVRLQWCKSESAEICWLLEVGRSDRFPLSTLVFRFLRDGNKKASEVAVQRLLETLLDFNGWWKRDKVSELVGTTLSNCRLIQHVNRRTETRAKRLYQEAARMVGLRH